jgi:hypothetical protein
MPYKPMNSLSCNKIKSMLRDVSDLPILIGDRFCIKAGMKSFEAFQTGFGKIGVAGLPGRLP